MCRACTTHSPRAARGERLLVLEAERQVIGLVDAVLGHPDPESCAVGCCLLAPHLSGDPVGVIESCTPRVREIARRGRLTEILMVPLRECSGCAEAATVRSMNDLEIRPAVAADTLAVKSVTDAAYRHYIARMGAVPQPMEADHAADVAAGRVFVTGEPVTGLVVLDAYEDHLFLDSIAVRPDAHGQGVGRQAAAVRRRARARARPVRDQLHERDDVGEPEDLPSTEDPHQ
ncbi:hypothetical protein SGLAM104S_05693 [Streptomyces glaucescens]